MEVDQREDCRRACDGICVGDIKTSKSDRGSKYERRKSTTVHIHKKNGSLSVSERRSGKWEKDRLMYLRNWYKGFNISRTPTGFYRLCRSRVLIHTRPPSSPRCCLRTRMMRVYRERSKRCVSGQYSSIDQVCRVRGGQTRYEATQRQGCEAPQMNVERKTRCNRKRATETYTRPWTT